MNVGADKSEPLTAIHTDLGAIFVSMELSRSSWLITSLSPGGGEKMSKHSVPAGDICMLLKRFSALKQKAVSSQERAFVGAHHCVLIVAPVMGRTRLAKNSV